jgi:hypothetical protein
MMTELKPLINATIKERYVPEYQAGISDAEALGAMIASYFKWDGIQILNAMQYALEDANFHSINEQINTIREKEDLL